MEVRSKMIPCTAALDRKVHGPAKGMDCRVKEVLSIPVIATGNFSVEAAMRCLEERADGVMCSRELGYPFWLEIDYFLKNGVEK